VTSSLTTNCTPATITISPRTESTCSSPRPMPVGDLLDKARPEPGDPYIQIDEERQKGHRANLLAGPVMVAAVRPVNALAMTPAAAVPPWLSDATRLD
jgi:hypothetical protein